MATPPHSIPGSVIANVDSISAPELVYPEAIYLHNGETYLVRELDLAGKVAYVERRETDYYTQAVLESNVRITSTRAKHGNDDESAAAHTFPKASRGVPARGAQPTQPVAAERALIAYGDVEVSWQTVAFKKIKFATRENIGLGPVDIPPQQLATTAFWLSPDDDLRRELKLAGLRASEGLTGLRNLAVVALPLVAMCDSRDLGGVVDSQNLGRAAMIVYDRYPGGLGYSEKGFQFVDQLLAICRDMVASCPCDAGCPSCVGLPNLRPAIHSDPDLTRGHPMPNKQATLRLVELLCGGAASPAAPLRAASPAAAGE